MTSPADDLPRVIIEMINERCRPSTERPADRQAKHPPLVVGVCGAQGSGKSTLARLLAGQLEAAGRSAAILSIDDLYLTKAEREALGREVHPMLRVRGVPGTHDWQFGLRLLAGLDAGQSVMLPRFDKATDERAPAAAGSMVAPSPDVLIFEGWCVGAVPQAEEELVAPINALEASCDGKGIWRRYVNTQLAAGYQRLFERVDLLILLQAPSFDIVLSWRQEQERALRARQGGGMSDDEIIEFIAYYERLTRHILREMPARADLTVSLDEARGVIAMVTRDSFPGRDRNKVG